MTDQSGARKLDLAVAIERGALRSATVVHRAPDNPTIDSIALISRPEQARRVAPRSAVVIAAGQQTSGWLVSSVLRYAWERRASVVVAAGAQPDSVLVLARRLGITLLSTLDDPTKLALDLASEIGAANAAVDAQLVSLLRIVTREHTVDGILRKAAAELGDVPLELTYRDSIIAAAGKSDAGERIQLGPYGMVGSTGDGVAIRAFPRKAGRQATLTEGALALIIPYLRAAWLEAEISDRFDGLAAAAAAEDAAGEDTHGRPKLVEQLGWGDGDYHFVVFLRHATGYGSRTLSNVVRLLWRRSMGPGALSEVPGGWITVLTADDENSVSTAVRRLRARLAPGLKEVGVGIGVSRIDSAPERLSDLVTEARLAARCAWIPGDEGVGSFDELKLSAVAYLFEPADAQVIARLVLPEFCSAPDLTTLVESVAAFVNERSVTAAAAALDVHRNTLTARLDRARVLGLPVGDPSMAFAVAAVIRALDPGLDQHHRTSHTRPSEVGDEP